MSPKLKRQLAVVAACLVLIVVGRQVWYGQIEWLSGATEDDILAVIAETSSVAGFQALERFSQVEADRVRDIIRRDLRHQRAGVTSSIAARSLVADVRRLHAGLLRKAPDDHNRRVLVYLGRWFDAVRGDAEMCERVLAYGDIGVPLHRLDDVAGGDLRDASVVFDAMRAATRAPVDRAEPVDDEAAAFLAGLADGGFPAADLAALGAQTFNAPEICAVMHRYLNAVAEAEGPLAEKIRAAIASGMIAI